MDLYQINSKYYCGVDMHARSMYVTVLDNDGNIKFQRNMQNDFKTFKQSMQPFLPDLAVGSESTFMYYWLSDCCRDEGIPFYMGHAYYMKTIHGGKKKNDKLDSKKIADLMRCNHLPKAYAYPKEWRATRDLLRRRHHIMHIRSECYSHIQNTFTQQCKEITPNEVRDKSTRRNLEDLLGDPDLKTIIKTDLDVIEFIDPLLKKLELQIRIRAREHDRTLLNLMLTIPGVGEMHSLILLYEIYDINRFPSPQQFSSYCRLVKCERSSAGKKSGGGNQKIGNPYLKWSIGNIILSAVKVSPLINTHYQRLQSKFGKGRSKSIISHKFGIAIYYMLKNKEVFDAARFVGMN